MSSTHKNERDWDDIQAESEALIAQADDEAEAFAEETGREYVRDAHALLPNGEDES